MSDIKLSSDLKHSKGMSATLGPDHTFEIPAKLIKTPADMKIWEKSEAYYEYLGFILAINEAVKGKSNSQGSENPSETIVKLVNLLDKLDALIDETPPVQQPQRFGNVAFKTWYTKMRETSLVLLQEVMNPTLYKAVTEVVCYLVESFGNSTRIDYGTGLLHEADKVATGCYLFPRYLDLARKLQKTYRMEPAGSHGVWSLDDYQFVPFIWGSSQLFAHPIIEPSGFLKEQILCKYGEDYMFLTCIQFINSVKSGPFAEHSNQLWSISGVSSWTKINGGLIKMYKAEILSKFPVVQHIVFGSIFTLKLVEQVGGMISRSMPPPLSTLSVSSQSSDSTTRSKISLLAGSGTSPNDTETSEESTSKISKSLLSATDSNSSSSEAALEKVRVVPREPAGEGSLPKIDHGKDRMPGEPGEQDGPNRSSSISQSVDKESVRFLVASDEPGDHKKKFMPSIRPPH